MILISKLILLSKINVSSKEQSTITDCLFIIIIIVQSYKCQRQHCFIGVFATIREINFCLNFRICCLEIQ